MSEEIIQRIEERLIALNKKASRASIEAGLGVGAIRDLQRGRRGKIIAPTIATLEKLAPVLETTAEYLAFGSRKNSKRVTNHVTLPVLGEMATGSWLEVDSDKSMCFDPIPVAPDARYPADAQYGLIGRGTSLNKHISDGEIAHCVDIMKTGIVPFHGDLVVVERRKPNNDIEVSGKKFVVKPDGTPRLEADSTDEKWKGYYITPDDNQEITITIKAIIIRAYREFR